MKKTIYIFLLLIGVVILSCEDNLERFPIDGPSTGTFPANEKELLMGANGCYTFLTYQISSGVPFSLMMEHFTDISAYRYSGTAIQLIANGAVDSNDEWFLAIWRQIYKGVSACNFLLENMSLAEKNTNPDVYRRVRSEVRVLRAFYYFYLTEFWGGVPLITSYINLEEAKMPRTDKGVIVEFIINELKESVADLPWTYDATQNGRVNKGTALGLLSRIALYNERWDDAANAANEIILSKQYKLNEDYSSLFTYAGEYSNEILFSAQFTKGSDTHQYPYRYQTRMAKGFCVAFPTMELVDSYECTDGLSIDKSPLYDPKHPEKNRDPRLNYNIVMPNTEFMGFQFETHVDSTMCWNYTTKKRVKNEDSTNAYASATGFCWKKFLDPNETDMKQSEMNIILMRYAEILLNYAEAKIEKDDIDASVYDAINLIRDRKSVKMPLITSGKTQNEMRSVVRKERKYELAGEGLRLYDIRRWKLAETVMDGAMYGRPRVSKTRCWMNEPPIIDQWGTPDYSKISNKNDRRVLDNRVFLAEKNYLWPIPQLEIDLNDKLVQNPNW